MRPAGLDGPKDTGRMGFRRPDEPKDERPVLWIRPFWKSPEEKAAYLEAVRNHPREYDTAKRTMESPYAYIPRLAALAEKALLAPAAKAFPSERPLSQEYRGPRPETSEKGLSFEDRTDLIYERQPGEDDE